MAEAILSAPRFNNDEAAREYLEAIRWPNGPVCPHCGGTERNSPLQGESHRAGLIFCGDCRQQFTVTVGTVFERSKIALHKWVLATHLLCSSKKGMSSKQLERTLGVTYKTAWFMSHRIREAMKDSNGGMFGTGGGFVEADETFIGNDENHARKPGKFKAGYGHKRKVLALIDRETGKSRTDKKPDIPPDDMTAESIQAVVEEIRTLSEDLFSWKLRFRGVELPQSGQ